MFANVWIVPVSLLMNVQYGRNARKLVAHASSKGRCCSSALPPPMIDLANKRCVATSHLPYCDTAREAFPPFDGHLHVGRLEFKTEAHASCAFGGDQRAPGSQKK